MREQRREMLERAGRSEAAARLRPPRGPTEEALHPPFHRLHRVTLLSQHLVIANVFAAVDALLRTKSAGLFEQLRVFHQADVRLDGADEKPLPERKEDGKSVEEKGDRPPTAVPIARNIRADIESQVADLELGSGRHGENCKVAALRGAGSAVPSFCHFGPSSPLCGKAIALPAEIALGIGKITAMRASSCARARAAAAAIPAPRGPARTTGGEWRTRRGGAGSRREHAPDTPYAA